jgi:hypothetical protein
MPGTVRGVSNEVRVLLGVGALVSLLVGVILLSISGRVTVPYTIYSSAPVACASVWRAWTGHLVETSSLAGVYSHVQCEVQRRNRATVAVTLMVLGSIVGALVIWCDYVIPPPGWRDIQR